MTLPTLQTITRISCITTVVLALANVLVSNQMADRGLELTSIKVEQANIAKDNILKTEEIAKNMSLSKIESQALSLGFVKVTNTVALDNMAQVALANR